MRIIWEYINKVLKLIVVLSVHLMSIRIDLRNTQPLQRSLFLMYWSWRRLIQTILFLLLMWINWIDELFSCRNLKRKMQLLLLRLLYLPGRSSSQKLIIADLITTFGKCKSTYILNTLLILSILCRGVSISCNTVNFKFYYFSLFYFSKFMQRNPFLFGTTKEQVRG